MQDVKNSGRDSIGQGSKPSLDYENIKTFLNQNGGDPINMNDQR